MSLSSVYPKHPDSQSAVPDIAPRADPPARLGTAFAARPDAMLALIHDMHAASMMSLNAWFAWPAWFMGAMPPLRAASTRIPHSLTVTAISSRPLPVPPADPTLNTHVLADAEQTAGAADRLTVPADAPAASASVALPPGPVVVDVAGTVLTDTERERLRHPLVGAVILFARNFSTRAELQTLTAEIHAARNGPLLIAVDHEGGRVQRFRTDGFTVLPAMRALGEQWMHDPMGAMRRATDIGYVLAAELRACGVDFSFAPVLDLDYGGSTVIGTRSFHDDARVVAMLARAVAQGMALAGMGACGKHFPGHGFVNADSHVAIPVDERKLDEILEKDAAPYAWLGDAVLPAVMPAHVIYPKVDKQPAGFSKKWIKTILRGRLGYDGVVFSDDLSMEGASVAGDMLARAKAALAAGCDMVLVCNRPDLADDLLARLDHQPVAASTARIRRLMPVVPALDWDALQALPRFQSARQSARAEG